MASDEKEPSTTDKPSRPVKEHGKKQQPTGETEKESPLEEIDDSLVRPENS